MPGNHRSSISLHHRWWIFQATMASILVGLGVPLALREFGPPAERAFEFQVLDESGEPVVGATVTPQWFQAGGSHHQFQVNAKRFPPDGKLFPPATTDVEGVVRIVIPGDSAIAKAGYSSQMENEVRETLRQQFLLVHLRVDHPNHPLWNDRVIGKTTRSTIVIPDSSTLVVQAHRGDEESLARNLYPALSQSWEGTDYSEADGVLTIRRVALTGKKASHWLRIVHIPDDGPAWFSELIDLQQSSGPVVSLDVKLKPGVRFEGRLAEDVPHPVANGRIVAEINSGVGFPDGWHWRAAADIAPDGTFVLDSLPENENLQLTAFCDGWVSRSPTSDEVKAYDAIHSFAAPDYRKQLQARHYHAFPQLFRLNAPVVEAIVPMGRTSVAEVVVVDEKGAPIENARVGFWPNVLWFHGGAGLLRQGYDRLTMTRAELSSGKRRTDADEWKPGENRYSATTNSKGVAIVSDLPAGATGAPDEPREFKLQVEHEGYESTAPVNPKAPFPTWTIPLAPGQTGSVTVQLKRK